MLWPFNGQHIVTGIDIFYKYLELMKSFYNVKKNMTIYSDTLKMNNEALKNHKYVQHTSDSIASCGTSQPKNSYKLKIGYITTVIESQCIIFTKKPIAVRPDDMSLMVERPVKKRKSRSCVLCDSDSCKGRLNVTKCTLS